MEDGFPLKSKVVISPTGHEITIPEVDYSDEGGYKCAAENSRSEPESTWVSKVIQLKVECEYSGLSLFMHKWSCNLKFQYK